MENNKETTKYTAKIHTHEDGEIHIEVSVPWENVEKHRSSVIKKFSSNIKVDGFRQGHVPEAVVLQNISSAVILEEMAERTIQEIYPMVIKDESLETIGHPHISITKLAEKNPLEFTAHVTELPKLELPDYKKIAKEVNAEAKEVKVEDKEVEDAKEHIRKEWAKSEKMHARATVEGKKVNEIDPKSIEIKDEDLPELNDEFAQKIGPFKDLKDFTEKLTENILNEKKRREQDKNRALLLEKIRKEIKLKLPDVIINSELDRMEAQFKSDVERLGMKFEDYLKQTEKKIEDLRVEWKPDAENYAKNQMILNKIAIEEKIEPDKEKRDLEVKEILKNYKDAKRERVEIYVDTIMTNDLVLGFLENQK